MEYAVDAMKIGIPLQIAGKKIAVRRFCSPNTQSYDRFCLEMGFSIVVYGRSFYKKRCVPSCSLPVVCLNFCMADVPKSRTGSIFKQKLNQRPQKIERELEVLKHNVRYVCFQKTIKLVIYTFLNDKRTKRFLKEKTNWQQKRYLPEFSTNLLCSCT